MSYAIGHISGCLNPAVSVGLWAGGRFPAAQRTGGRRLVSRPSPSACALPAGLVYRNVFEKE